MSSGFSSFRDLWKRQPPSSANPESIEDIKNTVDGSEIWRSSVEVGSLSHYSQGFYASQVVQDFFHQQCLRRVLQLSRFHNEWPKKKKQNRSFFSQRTNSSCDCVWRWQSALTPMVFHPWPIFFFKHVATSNAGGLGLIPINAAKDYPPEN